MRTVRRRWIRAITSPGTTGWWGADKAQDRLKELERKRTERMAKADAIGGFMFRLRELNQPMDHFDERLWLDVIDCVVVHRDGLTIKFQNGKEIRV